MNRSPDGIARRTVLSSAMASGTALVAGCPGPAAILGGRDEPPEDATATVEITNVAAFAPDRSLEASVDVVRPWATSDDPPAIEITLENTAFLSRHTLIAGSGDWAILSDRASDRVEPGVALLGEEEDAREFALDREPDGCWKLDNTTNSPLRVLRTTSPAPRKTVSMQIEVWGHYENAEDVCLPTGEFTFSETYTIESNPDRPTFEWEFSLRIEAVD